MCACSFIEGGGNTLWILISQLFLKLVYFESNNDTEGTFGKLINITVAVFFPTMYHQGII